MFDFIFTDSKLVVFLQKYPNFTGVRGQEVFITSPNIHYFLNVKIIFYPSHLTIEYDSSSKIFVIFILMSILTDPYFEFTHIIWTNEKQSFSSELRNWETIKLDPKKIYNKIVNKVLTTSSVSIFGDSDNINYQKQIIIYPIFNDKPDFFFLYQEMDRWQNLNG
jgi:hypothetical protein